MSASVYPWPRPLSSDAPLLSCIALNAVSALRFASIAHYSSRTLSLTYLAHGAFVGSGIDAMSLSVWLVAFLAERIGIVSL